VQSGSVVGNTALSLCVAIPQETDENWRESVLSQKDASIALQLGWLAVDDLGPVV
jgi:hypothetical protein